MTIRVAQRDTMAGNRVTCEDGSDTEDEEDDPQDNDKPPHAHAHVIKTPLAHNSSLHIEISSSTPHPVLSALNMPTQLPLFS